MSSKRSSSSRPRRRSSVQQDRRNSSPGGKPLFGNCEMGAKIGSGAFGEIYLGHDISTGEQLAIKLEPLGAKPPQLKAEAKLCMEIAGPGVPSVRYCGQENGYTCCVMTLLGPTIEDLFAYCHNHFSIKTICMLGDQLVTLLEHLHTHGVIHRDVKPENFLMGLGPRGNRVHVIDFGLSKRYIDPKTGDHIPFKTGKRLVGTARYASVGTHLGYEQSRRDDLEGVAYVLIQLHRGTLPWQGLKAASAQLKNDKIRDVKIATPVADLCKGLPDEFVAFLEYARSLKFTEEPDYDYLRTLFRNVLFRNGHDYDFVFDWTASPEESAPAPDPFPPPEAAAAGGGAMLETVAE